MSSTALKEPSTQGPEDKSKIGIPPVPIIDTPLSKSVALIRPTLVLSLLAIRFNELVAEPVSTLRVALPVVAIIQAIYAILCLPVAGSYTAKVAKKSRPGEKKKTDANSPNVISTAVLALLLTAISTPAVYVLFILFGAPFLDHVAHTLLCAAHFSLLGLFPVFYSRGVSSQALLAIAGASAPLDEPFGALVGAVVGAWLGAIPIPLDWDREWQKWPITILVGLYTGSLSFSFASGWLLYGKHLAEAGEKDE
ncbi:Glycosylphosphatidylinositol (GPI) anchor assembly protein [Conoideocrella luteorostrata]|uniref:Glycosylphosphatidylinositol (GPI) anchor assembly protein n=1 Tax=Conoideocrella luteorostrata TaxID=1105319 RepID=A0AAJ0CSX5_9HYPO|nr:Glycosylphosphatidylinositol (GPI) anchor assembly protein [Conoideocrella luteorostrata]